MTAPELAARRRRRTGDSYAPVLDISSLIDVGFLLLVYFVVTSSLQKKESDLDIKMAVHGGIDTTRTRLYPIEIDLDRDGTIAVDGTVVCRDTNVRLSPALDGKLEELTKGLEAVDQIPVGIVRADDEATHQRLVDVVNALAKHGVTKVTMAGFAE